MDMDCGQNGYHNKHVTQTPTLKAVIRKQAYFCGEDVQVQTVLPANDFAVRSNLHAFRSELRGVPFSYPW
jgi:hypothetical protein